MTIKNSVRFNYAGIDSEDYGLINVNYDVSLPDELFISERDIEVSQSAGRDDVYFVDVVNLPLVIDLHFAFKYGFGKNHEYLTEVSRWLNQDYYQPLIFSEQPNRIYYCMCDGDTELIHNQAGAGLISLTMRNMDNYARSQFYISDIYESISDVNIYNWGDVELKPIIYIEMLEDMNIFTLLNTNNLTKLEFRELQSGDEIFVDLNHKIVEAENNNTKIYLYDNLKDSSLLFDVGENHITASMGDWRLRFKYQYKFL